ncbi:MAG: DUF503 domain-containing protein [Planctomycetes bacterium]|nr:DUF503 domain-containing protein [Planctomycetota bacterium]
MVIGTMQISAFISDSHSLKDKRQVLRSVKARIHDKFNVSIAEVADNDLWQKVGLGVAVVSNDSKHALGVLQEVEKFLKTHPGLIVCSAETEIL